MKINNEDELLEKFAAKLVEDKGKILDEAEKKVEVERIVEEVDDIFIDEIIDNLPEDRRRALDKAVDEHDEIPEQVLNNVIMGAKLDYSKIVKKVLGNYREKYLKEDA